MRQGGHSCLVLGLKVDRGAGVTRRCVGLCTTGAGCYRHGRQASPRQHVDTTRPGRRVPVAMQPTGRALLRNEVQKDAEEFTLRLNAFSYHAAEYSGLLPDYLKRT